MTTMLVTELLFLIFILNASLEKALDSYDFDEGEAPSWINVEKQQEAIVDRWYVDIKTAKCKPFKYKGSLGNFNNFVSQDVCKNHLKFTPEEQVNACDEPMAKGACMLPDDEKFERWYYSKSAVVLDGETNYCHKFMYSGCGGNANNFNSLADCKNACHNKVNSKVEDSVDDTTLTKVPNEFDCLFSAEVDTHDPIMRIVLHKNKKQCVYAAVGKKATRGFFEDLPSCVEKCIPKPVPACNTDTPFQVTPDNIIDREENNNLNEYFYFKKSEKVCLNFLSQIPDDNNIIGDGENNIFSSVELCASFCPATKNIGEIKAVEACKQPTVGVFQNGDKYKLSRFSYVIIYGNGSCQEFKFNGKHLNSNNFKTMAACKEICEKPLKANVQAAARNPISTKPEVQVVEEIRQDTVDRNKDGVTEETVTELDSRGTPPGPSNGRSVTKNKIWSSCNFWDTPCWHKYFKFT